MKEMNIIKRSICLILFGGLAAFTGCESDPEGPVAAKFVEDGSYAPEAGETFCFIDTLKQVTLVHRPTNLGGYTSLLKLGKNHGVRFETLLISFDFDSLPNDSGKTVSRASLDFPLVSVPGDFGLSTGIKIGIYELNEGFNEDDTLSASTLPSWSAGQITDSLGSVPERVISGESDNKFSINKQIVQDWLDGTDDPWPNGLAIVLEEEPDSMGFFEINSASLESNPIALRVTYEDSTQSPFGADEDYCVPSYHDQGGYSVAGGLATRVHFEFSLEGLTDSAIVHYSALVLNVEGEKGFGITGAGEQSLGLTPDFYYYLYAPDTTDSGSQAFFEGTGVDRGQFFTEVTEQIEMSLGKYTVDVIDGTRKNTGLVLQSDLENSRFQKAHFYRGEDPARSPYIKIIYSLPPKFDTE